MTKIISQEFSKNKNGGRNSDSRISVVAFLILSGFVVIIVKLFIMMILQNSFYTALAAGSHEVFAKIFPKRGSVFIQDSRTGEEYPLAINRDLFLLFADTRLIETEWDARQNVNKLAEILKFDDVKKEDVFNQLNKRNDPYEPIEKKMNENTMQEIKNLNLPGISFVRTPYRFYPEGSLAAHVAGFVGKDSGGNDVGRYGIEGYWEKELGGSGGFYEGLKTALGNRITFGDGLFEPAQDGADIVLTIDRTLQYKACEILEQDRKEYEAQSASLIIMDPYTGSIRAMCSLPDFDPNKYNEVESIDVYNNSSIFTPYEPGSIFKPVVMAAAINEGAVKPETTFIDSGSREGICDTPIKNANDKKYDLQTMIGVLENSINTGMVFVAEKLGKEKMRDYIKDFGFGLKTGIELDTESGGTIESLSKNKIEKIDCYSATASFGQGITVTPIQMIMAFAAISNGGTLIKPKIVDEIRYSDGRIEKIKTKEIKRVISSATSVLVSGMLVNVVDSGQAGKAKVPGYYISGKTGTAQIPGPGGYTEETIHSFVGFGPALDPKFVMIVKFEKPKRAYSVSTAAPTFGKIAKFILEYYGVPPGM